MISSERRHLVDRTFDNCLLDHGVLGEMQLMRRADRSQRSFLSVRGQYHRTEKTNVANHGHAPAFAYLAVFMSPSSAPSSSFRAPSGGSAVHLVSGPLQGSFTLAPIGFRSYPAEFGPGKAV